MKDQVRYLASENEQETLEVSPVPKRRAVAAATERFLGKSVITREVSSVRNVHAVAAATERFLENRAVAAGKVRNPLPFSPTFLQTGA